MNNLCSNHIDLKSLERLAECNAQSFLAGPHGEPVLVDEQRWNDIKNSLKKQLLLVYSPAHPEKFLEYKLEGTNWTGDTSYSDSVMNGDVTRNVPTPVIHRKRLAEAIHGVGGIGVFLFLFAKVPYFRLSFWNKILQSMIKLVKCVPQYYSIWSIGLKKTLYPLINYFFRG